MDSVRNLFEFGKNMYYKTNDRKDKNAMHTSLKH